MDNQRTDEQQGSMSIGDVLKHLHGKSRKSSTSLQTKLSDKSKSSGITGQRSQEQKLASVIGMQRLGSGVAELIQGTPKEFPGQAAEEAAARELYSLLKSSKKLPSGAKEWGTALLTCLRGENEHGRKALRVMAMLGHFPSQIQNEAVAEVVAEDYLKAIDHLPAYAVENGVRALMMRDLKRRPTPKVLLEACEQKAWRYRNLRDFIKKLAKHWGEVA